MFVLRSISCLQAGKSLVRNYVNTLKINPGVHKRKSALDIENLEDQEDLDDLEADFMHVDKSHKEHEKDIELQRERLKYLIVKRKYFKQKALPNFLTWHDREQINYLHSTDPTEWTIEKLSESFPALPDTIQKVVRAKYTKSPSKIANHDRSVQKNWEMFKNGKLQDLPQELIDHLKKFTNRSLTLNTFSQSDVKREVTFVKTAATTDFSEIITSYERLKKKETVQQDKEINISNPNIIFDNDSKDSGLLGKIKNKRQVTLQQLHRNIKDNVVAGGNLHEDEKLIFTTKREKTESAAPPTFGQEYVVAISKNKYESTGGSLVQRPESTYSHLIYPERINIPKNLRKRNGIYKLNDCYYDRDGEFLYRVPGMQ